MMIIQIRNRDNKNKNIISTEIKILLQKLNIFMISNNKIDSSKKNRKPIIKYLIYKYIFDPGIPNYIISEKFESIIQTILTGHNIYIIINSQTETDKIYIIFKNPIAIISSIVN